MPTPPGSAVSTGVLLAIWDASETEWVTILTQWTAGHNERLVPRAVEVQRGALGTALSEITAVRGRLRHIDVETPLMETDDADDLEALVTTGLDVWVDGTMIYDGPMLGVCSPPRTRWGPVNTVRSLIFTIRETAVAPEES